MDTDKLQAARGCINGLLISAAGIAFAVGLYKLFGYLKAHGVTASTVLAGVGVVLLIVLVIGAFGGKSDMDSEK